MALGKGGPDLDEKKVLGPTGGPSSGGTISRRLPPTFIDLSPNSNPGIMPAGRSPRPRQRGLRIAVEGSAEKWRVGRWRVRVARSGGRGDSPLIPSLVSVGRPPR